MSVLVLAGAVGCGPHTGSFVGAPPSPTPVPVSTATASASPLAGPTAPVIPEASPFSTATSVSLPAFSGAANASATPYPVELPASSGFGGTIALPIPVSAIAANTTLAEVVTSSVPDDIGLPLSLFRQSAARSTLSDATGNTALLFVGLTPSSPIVLDATLGFTFDVPAASIVSGADYYLAFYDPSAPQLAWQLGYSGPGSISGHRSRFRRSRCRRSSSWRPKSAIGGRSMRAATPRRRQRPSRRAPPPTPSSAAPTPTPVPTPIPDFTTSPTTIAFTAPGQTSAFTVDAPPAAGLLTASTSDPDIATVAAFGPNTFVVTAGSTPGVATITVRGAVSGASTITIGLTTTTGTFF